MPKGEKIKHDQFSLQFKVEDGEVKFRMDNSELDIFSDGYLSTEQFHKLRGIVNHGYNHLNKHYKAPKDSHAPWNDIDVLSVGSIIKFTKEHDSKMINENDLTLGKLYVVTQIPQTGWEAGCYVEGDTGLKAGLCQDQFEVVQY
jgi:hypothetical protein